MITMFKDIKDFSEEGSKEDPSIIIEEEHNSSGYNDYYNKLDI